MNGQELAAELAPRRWQELLALLYAARCLRPACMLSDACIAALRRALCVDNALPLALGAQPPALALA